MLEKLPIVVHTSGGSWSIIVELLHCSPNEATVNLREVSFNILHPTSIIFGFSPIAASSSKFSSYSNLFGLLLSNSKPTLPLRLF
jgi:hypothetical protein